MAFRLRPRASHSLKISEKIRECIRSIIRIIVFAKKFPAKNATWCLFDLPISVKKITVDSIGRRPIDGPFVSL